MSKTVLLVDDDRDLLDIMSERMETRGIAVTTASTAEEAFREIERGCFDVVVLDFMMPEMDGFKTLKLLKEKKPGLHVILLTGYATVETRAEAVKLGAMDFVEKPADIEQLTQKIKTAGT